MMVPRAYLYNSHPSSTSTKHNDEITMPISVAERVSRKDKAPKSGMPPKVLTPQSTTKPVVIPTKTRNGDRRKSKDSMSRDRTRKDISSPHDSSSTPSSVAALLAMTSLPEPKYHPRAENWRKGSIRAGSGKQDTRLKEIPRRAFSSCSPQSWGMLLGPPEGSEPESCSFESDTTLGPLSSVRSMSSESMPSLGTDTESLNSAGDPATPELAIGSRSGCDRRQKCISASKGEDCVLDHPLLPQVARRDLGNQSCEGFSDELSPGPTHAARSRSSFKSNLTASFRRIRSAAQSFPTFAAPAVPPDDYLSRSLLSISPQFTDERRPLPSDDTPDPALRRYLNPITVSPSELHYHLEKESPWSSQSDCKASIQLQTYRRREGGSDKASSPPVFTSQQQALDATDGVPPVSLPRQREPRENSHFLRVIVLEMNMRKVGKLSDASPGRARLWLPARQTGKMGLEEEAGKDEKKGTPQRWAGVQA
ncbi:hypothetical protein HO173_009915 [Letharia columbiana]|uniref:Uncharacterized protein n=1 Tax=Letharia columbiana TaxID=112416 RepID=A0A8H6FNL2_9LECA|nr:uncharacterized protein HO173_009915 [Letharia columbiana]KAF6231832.1 hypothetical protein HO173_009915 [Letharia columbiana]